MEKRWMKKHSGVAGTISKEVRDAKVGLEALKRIGKNVNLKGVVHEIMVKDKINLNPKNIITGTRAYLTKSSTAVRDDIIVKRAGHVIRRLQLKDTPASIRKTLEQVAEGKYAKTGLMGTKETTKAYNAEVAKKAVKGIKIAKKMQS